MDKVIIAYNLGEDDKKNELFKKNMSTAFSRLKMDGFETDSENVFVITQKEQVESIVPSEVSVIVSAEEVDGLRIGMGNLNRWRKSNPNAKIILIVSADKKSSAKLNALYNAEFYTVLYNNDFSWGNIKTLLINGRTKEDAYEYFGIADYVPHTKEEAPKEEKKPEEEVKTEQPKKNLVKVSMPPISEPKKAKDVSKGKAENGDADKVSTQKGDKSVSSSQKAERQQKKNSNKDVDAESAGKNQVFADKNNGVEGTSRESDGKNIAFANKNKGNKDAKAETKEQKQPLADKNIGDSLKSKEKPASEKYSVPTNDAPQSRKETSASKSEPVKSDKTLNKNSAVQKRADNNVKAGSPKDDDLLKKENRITEKGADADEYKEVVDDGDEYDELDTSAFLVRAMEDEELPEIDWLNATDEEVEEFIKQMDEKAFNQVTITKELSDEEKVLEEILRFYTKEDPIYIANLESGLITKAQFEQDLTQKIAAHRFLSPEQMKYVFDSFSMFMWNYDIITPFIEDPAVSDIALVDWNNIQVKRYGVRYFSKIVFRSEAHFRAFITHVVKHNHVDLSDKMPDKTFMDTTTSESARMRFVYSQEYINSNGEPSLVIRKVPTTKYTINDLVEKKMMTKQTAAYLLDKVRRGASIVFTGTMASGKSTCINTYLDYIRGDKRGLGVQENDELFSDTHKMFTFQNIRISEDGKQIFDLRYLTRYALLMDIDYLINGEIKGAESEQYIEAVFANIVTMTSVHSPSAYQALPRLADLGTTDQFSRKQQLRKLAEGIDFVVYLDKFVIMEIAEIVGWDEEKEDVIYNSVDITIPKKKINVTKYKRMLKE